MCLLAFGLLQDEKSLVIPVLKSNVSLCARSPDAVTPVWDCFHLSPSCVCLFDLLVISADPCCCDAPVGMVDSSASFSSPHGLLLSQ